MASIKDVAKKAGVSVSTVSRTMSDHDAISDKTKKKVRRVIKELNYSPNAMAQALSNNCSYNVTLLVNIKDVHSFNNIFFYEMMHGIESVVYEREYTLTIANVTNKEKYETIFERVIRSKKTEGLILPAAIFKEDMLKELKKMNIPYVLIGEIQESEKNLFWVDINNRKAGMQAVNFLLEKGCMQLAYVGFDEKNTFNRRRLEGFKEMVERKGLGPSCFSIFEGSNSKEEGYRIANLLLSQEGQVDGIVCADSYLALGVIQHFKEKGIQIPEQLKIISFDNPQIAELSYPSITTVDADMFDLGAKATKLLFSLLEDPAMSSQEILISTHIEERETT